MTRSAQWRSPRAEPWCLSSGEYRYRLIQYKQIQNSHFKALSIFLFFGYNSLKGKFRPRTDHEGLKVELTYSFTLSLTSELDRVGCQYYASTSILPGKETSIHFITGWVSPGGWYGRGRKNSPISGFDPQTIQTVASRYSDHAIPTHYNSLLKEFEQALALQVSEGKQQYRFGEINTLMR